jgi:glycerol-3-phosphate dehydrogenase
MIGYDMLSRKKSMPSHQMLSPHEGIKLLPGFVTEGLLSVAVYHDAQVQYSERLCLENMIDAERCGAVVQNHMKVSSFSIVDHNIESIQLTDGRTGSTKEVTARVVVNATGPWAGEVAGLAGLGESGWLSGRKGSHVVFDNINEAPNSLLHFESLIDQRALIIVPWLGMHLVGSTEVSHNGTPKNVQIGKKELNYLIDSVNGILPNAELTSNDVAFTYSGVRPLAFDPKGGSSKTTRRHRIIDHANDKEVSAIKGLVSLVGGKLTTYRSTSEEVAKLVARKLSQTEKHVHSEKALLPGGDVEAIREIESWFPKRHSISNRETSRLIDIYGSRTRLLSELIDREKSLGAPIGKKSGPLKAEVIQGFESEKAETLVDLLARRMMLTWTPSLGLDSAKEIAVVASQYLGWSRERVSDELKNYETFVNQFRAHLEKRPL